MWQELRQREDDEKILDNFHLAHCFMKCQRLLNKLFPGIRQVRRVPCFPYRYALQGFSVGREKKKVSYVRTLPVTYLMVEET